MLDRAKFQTKVDGKQTDLFFLEGANGLRIAATNYGGRVVAIWAPDRNGQLADIALGRASIEAYLYPVGERFLGAAIGRFGNRIAGGRFTLDGKTYSLAQNNGKNSLHGGVKSFDCVVWDVLHHDAHSLELFYRSPDGEEGFPADVCVFMTYRVEGDDLDITYRAVSSGRTPLNLTHHSYFNLKGEGQGDINDHVLTIRAAHYDPVDVDMIPNTPAGANVEGTPMDFRKATAIGARVEADFPALKNARGYDHNWILERTTKDGLELAAAVYEPASGRRLEVYTTEPAIQFYGGNFFDGKAVGKAGKPYGFRSGFALETQHYPDAPNRPQTPTTILEPGAPYFQRCVYRFKTD